MESWVVATGLIVLYLLFTIVLGVVANRRLSGDMEDFLLYGRKAGFVVLYLTVVASFHSAFAFLGSGGFFYTHGVGFWAAGTWTLLVGAITYVIGARIWALGKAFGYITPADMLADFYESEAVRVTVAVVLGALHYSVHPSPGAGARVHHQHRDRWQGVPQPRYADPVGRGGVLLNGWWIAGGLLDGCTPGHLDVRRGLGGRDRALVRTVWRSAPALAGRDDGTARPHNAPGT